MRACDPTATEKDHGMSIYTLPAIGIGGTG